MHQPILTYSTWRCNFDKVPWSHFWVFWLETWMELKVMMRSFHLCWLCACSILIWMLIKAVLQPCPYWVATSQKHQPCNFNIFLWSHFWVFWLEKWMKLKVWMWSLYLCWFCACSILLWMLIKAVSQPCPYWVATCQKHQPCNFNMVFWSHFWVFWHEKWMKLKVWMWSLYLCWFYAA